MKTEKSDWSKEAEMAHLFPAIRADAKNPSLAAIMPQDAREATTEPVQPAEDEAATQHPDLGEGTEVGKG